MPNAHTQLRSAFSAPGTIACQEALKTLLFDFGPTDFTASKYSTLQPPQCMLDHGELLFRNAQLSKALFVNVVLLAKMSCYAYPPSVLLLQFFLES